MKRKSLNMG
jgi:mitogen-activated protein kinase 1/3